MKLTQRLMIGYYKTKLKTIGLVSSRKAAETAYRIFCTPFKGRSKRKSPPVFHKAEKLSFLYDNLTIRGFRWKTEHPNGRKVLIIHGFSSYAYKFEKYILPLRKEGFEVLAFDAPAHGNSEGRLINAYIYKEVILEIEHLYGPLYALIGHSLGGLAASLAFESLTNNLQRKLVLIAPATETERAITNFFQIIPADPKTILAFRQLISEMTQQPVSYFSVSRVVKNLSAPILWVHDKQDPICTFEDVKPLLSLGLSHVRFLITEQLGHSRIYKDDKICHEIVGFLAEGNS
ncbi:MAG: alpha/beta fold hydrolase [Bacteroidota bacterium]|nr:alpha/beta fold hydrolase [Bacteroidota bacterium]